MLFHDIPGLGEVKEKLIQAVKQQHVAHALLFHGPVGSPTLPMALALATYLVCENKQEQDACGTCAACVKMSKLVHPDIHLIFPLPGAAAKDDEKDEKSDDKTSFRRFIQEKPYGLPSDWLYFLGAEKKQLNISKNSAREIVRSLSLKSFEGGAKLMFIWCPEFMHVNAANAILKILEEPPANTYFFLITHQPDQLLTTILSRTQKIAVRSYTDQEVADHLVQAGHCSETQAAQLAPLADGDMRRAYQLATQEEDSYTEKIKLWLRKCYVLDVPGLAQETEQYAKLGKEGQKAFLLAGLNVLREALLHSSQLSDLMRSAAGEREFIQKFSSGVLNAQKIEQLYVCLNEAYTHIERNANPKIQYTALSYQIYRILRA
ncbi:MAG: DNA polymerase III subunit [Nitritalea sp.]